MSQLKNDRVVELLLSSAISLGRDPRRYGVIRIKGGDFEQAAG